MFRLYFSRRIDTISPPPSNALSCRYSSYILFSKEQTIVWPFGKLAFQSSRACEKGPLGPSAVADCSRTHRDVRGPRPSKSRPTSSQPDIHHPTRSGLHTFLPQVVLEGQPKMPRLPSRYASAPRLWPESRDGDFRVGQLVVKDIKEEELRFSYNPHQRQYATPKMLPKRLKRHLLIIANLREMTVSS